MIDKLWATREAIKESKATRGLAVSKASSDWKHIQIKDSELDPLIRISRFWKMMPGHGKTESEHISIEG